MCLNFLNFFWKKIKIPYCFPISKFDLEIENRGTEVAVPNTPFLTMNGNLRYSLDNLFQKKSRLDLFYTLYYTGEFSYLVPQGSNTVGDDFFKVPEQLAQDFGMSYTFPKKRFVLSFDVSFRPVRELTDRTDFNRR